MQLTNTIIAHSDLIEIHLVCSPGGPLRYRGVHMHEQKKHVKRGLFFSTTRKTRFVFRGLKMLFCKKKLENGVFF